MKVTVAQLEDLSLGAVFLATGGGGDPYVARLLAEQALAASGGVELIAPAALDDDAFVVAIGGVGAPSIGLELLPSLGDPLRALQAFEAHVGRTVDALVSFEIGGGNSIVPLIAGAMSGKPVIDGDGMGRALPEAQMMTFPIGGVAPTPALALDYAGNLMTFAVDDPGTYERHVRGAAQAMGGMIVTVEHPMRGAALKQAVIPNTLSFAIEVGRILRQQRGHVDGLMAPLAELFRDSVYGGLFDLYRGKVTDWQSAVVGGYDVGRLTLEALQPPQPPMHIDVKNEFLMARVGDERVATVPDLIVVLDLETALPINAERIRYGQRVAVLGIGAPAFYRRPEALAVVAPRAFGFDVPFVPIEVLARQDDVGDQQAWAPQPR